jgi:hypothetical protein
MRCLTNFLAAAVIFGVASPNLAAAQDATAVAPSFQPADVQTEASRVYVFVEKSGLGHQHRVEAKLSISTLVLGATENAGQLVFDMTSFNADTPAARKCVGLTGTTDEGSRSAVNANMKASAVLNVRGNFTIKQTSFGITPYSKAFGAIGVADELKIYGDLFVAPTRHVAMNDIPARQ